MSKSQRWAKRKRYPAGVRATTYLTARRSSTARAREIESFRFPAEIDRFG